MDRDAAQYLGICRDLLGWGAGAGEVGSSCENVLEDVWKVSWRGNGRSVEAHRVVRRQMGYIGWWVDLPMDGSAGGGGCGLVRCGAVLGAIAPVSSQLWGSGGGLGEYMDSSSGRLHKQYALWIFDGKSLG
ncbi:hypothetical protein PMIN07_005420 [Paraphaeosphaeria minitans]